MPALQKRPGVFAFPLRGELLELAVGHDDGNRLPMAREPQENKRRQLRMCDLAPIDDSAGTASQAREPSV
jgi:hypothetical protein